MTYKIKLNKKQIGLNLHNLICERNFNYGFIADFLELKSPRVIYEWVGGSKLASVENLYNLASLFNVTIEDILG